MKERATQKGETIQSIHFTLTYEDPIMRDLTDEPKKKIKTIFGTIEISNEALEEIKYLHKGGSSVHPLYIAELKSLHAICKIEYIVGNRLNAGCMYPLATLTGVGNAIAKGQS